MPDCAIINIVHGNWIKTRWGISTVGSAQRSHRWGQGFESPMLHHIKYQLLIQRLVLFFYPMVAQIPLQQGLSRTFLEKVFWSSFIFHYTNRRGEQFCLPRLCFLPHPGQNDVFLIFVKSFRSVNMWLSHRLHQLEQQLFLSLCECTPFWKKLLLFRG